VSKQPRCPHERLAIGHDDCGAIDEALQSRVLPHHHQDCHIDRAQITTLTRLNAPGDEIDRFFQGQRIERPVEDGHALGSRRRRRRRKRWLH
jgi:hypothetical protein